MWEVVLRDHATDYDPSVRFQCVKGSLQRFAANVLEVDGNAVRCKPCKRILGTFFLVVESAVEAELVDDVFEFIIVSDRINYSKALVLCELAN